MRKIAGLALALLALWLVVAAAGCEDEGDSIPTTDTGNVPPPPPPPTTTETTTTTEATTTQTQGGGASSPAAEYPLTQQQAYALVEGGVSVAGYRPNGFEVLIIKSSETDYVEQPVEKEVCGYEYDPIEGKDVYGCDWETVYEEQPVEKTVYVVRGYEISPVSFPNAVGAFAEAAQWGAERWWRTP